MDLQMKRLFRMAIMTVFLASIMAIGVWVMKAHAAAATLEQQQAIVARCDQLKVQLANVQKNETATRVNRGRVYDLEVIPYITAFNSRIAASKVDAPELISVAAQIQSSVTSYANQFTTYSDDLTTAQRIDCKVKPAEFYDWVDKARADRATLAGQVTRTDQLIASYTNELQKLEQRFTPVINGSSKQ